MNQRERQMKDSLLNKQRLIQISSDVFWTLQLIRNLSKDDEQYILRTIVWRSTCKLYRQLCNSSKNNERTRRMKDLLFKNSGEAQLIFQAVKM